MNKEKFSHIEIAQHLLSSVRKSFLKPWLRFSTLTKQRNHGRNHGRLLLFLPILAHISTTQWWEEVVMKKTTIITTILAIVFFAGTVSATIVPKNFDSTDLLIERQTQADIRLTVKEEFPKVTIKRFGSFRIFAFDKEQDTRKTQGDLYSYAVEINTEIYDSTDGWEGEISWLYYAYGGKRGGVNVWAFETIPIWKGDSKGMKTFERHYRELKNYVRTKKHIKAARKMLAKKIESTERSRVSTAERIVGFLGGHKISPEECAAFHFQYPCD